MSHGYQVAKLMRLREVRDGQLVMLTGTCSRTQSRTRLTDRGAEVLLIGEPLDWWPEDGQLIDTWGEFFSGAMPYLILHDARPTGDLTRQPQRVKDRTEGFEGEFKARVTTYGDVCVAQTAQGRSYLLDQVIQPDGLYLLRGRLTHLQPPRFAVFQFTAVP